MSENKTSETSEFVAPAGSEFAKEISEHLREGDHGSASRAFARGWRDAVPDLPLRFSVILVRPDRDVIASLYKQLRDGDELEMCLQRVSASEVTVNLVDGGQRIGDIPAADARLLHELDADSALYRPQVSEVRYTARGRFDYIAVELVRPEVKLCSSCGEPHTTPHVNCAKCRSERRPKGEESYERAPLHLHDALDAVVTAPNLDGEDDDVFSS
jgi:hypothetical protein